MSIANAKLLHLQTREMIQHYTGTKLEVYLNEPLKSLVSPSGMVDLKTFAEGHSVQFDKFASIKQGSERKDGHYPKPIAAYPAWANLSLKAAFRPNTNNFVESKWSLLPQRYLSGVRNFKTEFMGITFRKGDFQNSGLIKSLSTAFFLVKFSEARAFRRKNKKNFKRFHKNDQEQSEQNRM